jgi:predicted acetyltransferase
MTFEIRPVRTDELNDFKRVAGTALVQGIADWETIRPEWTLGGFENGEITSSLAAWPFTMLFNQNDTPVSAVTTVGCLPAYRRRGYLRKIMTRHFELLHEHGQRSIAILWASLAAIYQRYDYAVVTTNVTYNLEPRYIQFIRPPKTKGSLRHAKESEFELLVDLYRRFRQDRTGYLHRGKPKWDGSILAPPAPGGSLIRTIYEENGEPQGYTIVSTIPVAGAEIPGHQMEIRDFIRLTKSAYQALWENLLTMDLFKNITWRRVPVDDPLPYLILEPRKLHATLADGILGRLVDVKKALTQRGYQAEGELIFSVIDEMCPWNHGCWKLEASPQGSRVTKSSKSPQVILPVSALALLAFGQICTTEAMRMGRLDVVEIDQLPIWDKVMKTLYRPACPDNF